jgi:hypothetical protein
VHQHLQQQNTYGFSQNLGSSITPTCTSKGNASKMFLACVHKQQQNSRRAKYENLNKESI